MQYSPICIDNDETFQVWNDTKKIFSSCYFSSDYMGEKFFVKVTFAEYGQVSGYIKSEKKIIIYYFYTELKKLVDSPMIIDFIPESGIITFFNSYTLTLRNFESLAALDNYLIRRELYLN